MKAQTQFGKKKAAAMALLAIALALIIGLFGGGQILAAEAAGPVVASDLAVVFNEIEAAKLADTSFAYTEYLGHNLDSGEGTITCARNGDTGAINFAFQDKFLGIGSAEGKTWFAAFLIQIDTEGTLATAVATGRVNMTFAALPTGASGNVTCVLAIKQFTAGDTPVFNMETIATGVTTGTPDVPASGGTPRAINVTTTLNADTVLAAVICTGTIMDNNSASVNYSNLSVSFSLSDYSAPKITALTMVPYVLGDVGFPCATEEENNRISGKTVDTLNILTSPDGKSTFKFPAWYNGNKNITSLVITDMAKPKPGEEMPQEITGINKVAFNDTMFLLTPENLVPDVWHDIFTEDDLVTPAARFAYVSHDTYTGSGEPVCQWIEFKVEIVENLSIAVTMTDNGNLARTEIIDVRGIDRYQPHAYEPESDQYSPDFPIVGPISHDGTAFDFGEFGSEAALSAVLDSVNWVVSKNAFIELAALVPDLDGLSPTVYYYSVTRTRNFTVAPVPAGSPSWRSSMNSSLAFSEIFKNTGYYCLALFGRNYAGSTTDVYYYYFKVDYTTPAFSVTKINLYQNVNPDIPGSGSLFQTYTAAQWAGAWTRYAVEIELTLAESFDELLSVDILRRSGVKFFYHFGDDDLIEIVQDATYELYSSGFYVVANLYADENSVDTFYLRLCFDYSDEELKLFEDYDAELSFAALSGAGLEYNLATPMTFKIDRNRPDEAETLTFDDYAYNPPAPKTWYTDGTSIELDFSSFYDDHLDDVELQFSLSSGFEPSGRVSVSGADLFAQGMFFELSLPALGVTSPGLKTVFTRAVDQAGNISETLAYGFLYDPTDYFVEFYVDNSMGTAHGGVAEFEPGVDYSLSQITVEGVVYTLYRAVFKRGETAVVNISMYEDFLFAKYNLWEYSEILEGASNYELSVLVDTANHVERPFWDSRYLVQGTARYALFYKRLIEIAIANPVNIYTGSGVAAVISYNIDMPSTAGLTVRYYASQGGAELPVPPKNAGTYYVEAVHMSDGYQSNTASGVFIIKPAPLAVVANAGTSVYNGAMPALSYTATGFVGGDTAETTASGALAIPSKNAGIYNITIGTLTFTNYAVAFTSAVWTIEKAPVYKVFESYETENFSVADVYTGMPHTITYLGVFDYYDLQTGVAGEMLRVTFKINGVNAGIYPIVVDEISDFGSGDPQNYEVTFGEMPGFVYTVFKRQLTITAQNASKIYGDPDPVIGWTASGFVEGENETQIISGGFRRSGTSDGAGDYEIEADPMNPFTLAADNYYINTETAGKVFTIHKRAISVYPYANQTKVAGVPLDEGLETIKFYYTGDTADLALVFEGNLAYQGYESYETETAGESRLITINTLSPIGDFAEENYIIEFFAEVYIELVESPAMSGTWLNLLPGNLIKRIYGIENPSYDVPAADLYSVYGSDWSIEGLDAGDTFELLYPNADALVFSIAYDASLTRLSPVGFYGGAAELRLAVPAAYTAKYGEYFISRWDVLVSKAPIYVRFAATSFVYGDAIADPMLSASVIIREDDEAGTLSQMFAGEYPLLKISATVAVPSGLGVGQYPIMLTNAKVLSRSGESGAYTYAESADSGNFEVLSASENGSYFAVVPRQITITIDEAALTKQYGDADLPVAFSVTGKLDDGSVLAGSFKRILRDGALTADGGRFDSVNTLLPTSAYYGIAINQAFTAGANYTIVFNYGAAGSLEGLRFTITPRQVTVGDEFFITQNKVYDGISAVSLAGSPLNFDFKARAADDVRVVFTADYCLLSGGNYIPTATAGSGLYIEYRGLGFGGAAAQNYVFVDASGDTVNAADTFHVGGAYITKLDFTIVTADFVVAEKEYDGLVWGELSSFSLPALFDNFTPEAEVVFASPAVSELARATVTLTYQITDAASNLVYNATDENVTVTINGSSIVITARNVLSRIAKKTLSYGQNGIILTLSDKIFDGSYSGSVTYSFGAGALVAGESIELEISCMLTSAEVGTTSATINSISIKPTGPYFENYRLTDEDYPILYAEILKARLVLGINFTPKVYDATTSVTGYGNSFGFTVNVGGASVNVNSLPYRYTKDGTEYTITDSTYIFLGNTEMISQFNWTYQNAYLVKKGATRTQASQHPWVVFDGSNNVALHDVLLSGIALSAESGSYFNNFTLVAYINGEIIPLETVNLTDKTGANPEAHENSVVLTAAASVERRMVSINLAEVMVSPKVYDGTKTASLTGLTAFSGLVAGDTVSVVYTVTLADANVKDNVLATFRVEAGPNGNGFSGASAKSYYLQNTISSYVKYQNITVTPRPLGVSFISVPGKVYDGTTAVYGNVSYTFQLAEDGIPGEGLIAADRDKIFLNISGKTFLSANVMIDAFGNGANHAKIYFSKNPESQLYGGAGVSVMNYRLKGAIAEGDKVYLLTTVPAAITPMRVSPTVITTPKIYDGTTSLDIAGVSVRVSIGMVTLYARPIAGGASFDTPNAGANKTVTVLLQQGLWDGPGLGANLVSNYSLGEPQAGEDYIVVKGSGSITKRQVFVYAENLSVPYGTQQFNFNKLYRMNYMGNLEWVTLKVIDTQKWWVYTDTNGIEQKVVIYTDRDSDLPIISSSFKPTTPVGTHRVLLSNLDIASNFSFNDSQNGQTVTSGGVTVATGELTIRKAVVTVYTDNYKRGYKGLNPEITLKFDGFKNGQIPGINVLEMHYPTAKFALVDEHGAYVADIVSNSSTPIGTSMSLPDGRTVYYVVYIDLSGASALYYEFALRPEFATLTIERAYVEGLSMVNRIFIYDGTPKSVTVTGTNSLISPAYLTYDYYPSTDGGLTFSDLPLAGPITEAGVYKVVASYDEGPSGNFTPWQAQSVMTISRKQLSIKLNSKSVSYNMSEVTVDNPVIANTTPAEYEMLMSKIVFVYTDMEGNVLSGPPSDAGKYFCVARYNAAAVDNYDTAQSNKVNVIISPIPVVITVTEKNFVFNEDVQPIQYTADSNSPLITDYSFISVAYMGSNLTQNSYGNPTPDVPLYPDTYTYRFTSSDPNIQLTGDIAGLMFIGVDTVSDAEEEELKKATMAPASGSSVILANLSVGYKNIIVRSTSTKQEESASNKIARYVWSTAERELRKFEIAAIVQCYLFDYDTFAEMQPSGAVNVTMKIPAAAPDEFRLFVLLDDGTFKELSYTQSGSYITTLTDVTGYFVFAYENTFPLELIIILAVGGAVVLVALFAGIALAKRSKRIKLVAKYVSEGIDARDFRVKKYNEKIDGATHFSILRDFDGESDLVFDEEEGEYRFADEQESGDDAGGTDI